MNFDIIVAGVGGQGVLSLSGIIAVSAMQEGLFVKQSEVHGMAQRGGAVTAHLRMADQPIESDLIPMGSASMVLSLEPLESLRYVAYLAPGGIIVSATEPIRNMDAYPPIDSVLDRIRALPGSVLVDAGALAKRAGLARATNMVMTGAAAPWLPVPASSIERCIRERFTGKGETVVQQNMAAFRAGQEVSTCTATR